MKVPRSTGTALLVLTLAGVLPPAGLAGGASAADPARAAASRAAEAYASGRCREVLAAFEALDEPARARLDGLSHYRWGFCAGVLGRGDPRAHYDAAARLLAAQAGGDGATRLETHFYLVNALLNLGEADRARSAASAAVALWKAGRLTVPEDRPDAWFRLGKLFQDAGDPRGALGPFARALDAETAHPGTLRDAYLERIADGARAARGIVLAERAQALLDARRPGDPGTLLRRARTLLAEGKLDEAEAAFNAVRRRRGDAGMEAQYATATIARIREVRKAGLEPATALADGTPLRDVDDLSGALQKTAARAFEVLGGPAIEKPRRKAPGTRFIPAPETKKQLDLVQAEFAGLLREAVIRGVPLREWAVQGGYAPLVHHRWKKLFRERAEKAREDEAKAAAASGADPE